MKSKHLFFGIALFATNAFGVNAQSTSNPCAHLIMNNDAFFECMRQDITRRLSPPPRPIPAAPPPAFAYFNPVTDEFFRGDQVFHRDEHSIAIETMNERNTRQPSGVGWRAITEGEYVNYLSIVLGTTQPIDRTIYNNCVIARSRDIPQSVFREVRASCRETAVNPSMLDRLRWGD
jgi:hypothetical protein